MAIVDSIFGDLAKSASLQALVDNTAIDLYPKAVWRQNLDVGLPQASLTFESVIGRSRVKAAASLVDPDAPAPKRGRPNLETLTGKIPTMKEGFEMNQADYRSLMTIKENSRLKQNGVDEMIVNFLNNDLKDAASSTDDRLDIMHIQGYSSFKVDASVIVNPDGITVGEVDLLAQPEQTRQVAKVWSDPTADPLKDIEAVVEYASGIGRSFSKIQIDRTTWGVMKNLASVKSAISAFYNPGSNKNYVVTLSSVNEYLVENLLPTIEVVNYRYGIQKDGIVSLINPFKATNVVFLPAGKLGTLHNAVAIEEWKKSPLKSYAKYGTALLSKFQDDNPWKEFTEVEMNAFPGLEAIDGIMHLQTDVAAV
ncbi:hypothetical protein DBR40_05310 [Pedobacter sp. KBW01]|uniref:major capsid protein n=1 Tax=Pedobacter sp. KBW01 TaxID=2153364 RepID=UPI000F5B6A96|nr:major capsid protein [Pedobacter sp. KBW01]RQO79139.1 hypothetical protein DBR40_05310 [Pedobacter sp. KBW01]